MPRSPVPLAGGPRAGPAPQLLRRPVAGRMAPLHRRRRADPADHPEAPHLAVEGMVRRHVTDHDEWNEQGPREVTAPRRNAHWRPAGPPPRPHVGPAGVVREAPTLGELAEAAYQRLPPQEAARLLAGAQPMAAGPRPDPGN